MNEPLRSYADIETDALEQLLLEKAYDRLDDKYEEICSNPEASDAQRAYAKTVYAQSLLERGELKRAVPLLTEVLREYPEFSRAWCLNGLVALSQSDWDGAQESYAQALSIEPDSEYGHVGLALCHARAGDIPGARNGFVSALTKNPSNVSALQGLLALECSEHFSSELEEILKRFLRLKPLDAGARFYLARLYRDRGSYNEALLEISKVLLLNPNDENAKTFKNEVAAVFSKSTS